MKNNVKVNSREIGKIDETLSSNNLLQADSYERLARKCNICGTRFNAHSRFERYCEACREDNELYRYADWL